MNKSHFVLAFAAAVPLAWWWAVPDGATQPAEAQGPLALSEPLPRIVLQLPQRALAAESRNPFGLPPQPPPVRVSAPADLPRAPQAPPLPYRYDGSGEVQGKSFVFLTRQGSAFMASAGDTLDGTYFVEALARDRVVLRYLPLGILQVMMYAGGEVPAEVAATADTGQPVSLEVDMPDEVVLGQEFVVTLALLRSPALKATVQVGYDAEVLSIMGAKVRRPGRAVVEVAGGAAPRAQLRFKVLADSPAFTDIDLQVSATDGAGKRVPVSAPSAHTVSLVLPGA